MLRQRPEVLIAFSDLSSGARTIIRSGCRIADTSMVASTSKLSNIPTAFWWFSTGWPLRVRTRSPAFSPHKSARSPETQCSTRHAPGCSCELLSVMPEPSPSPMMQIRVGTDSTNRRGDFAKDNRLETATRVATLATAMVGAGLRGGRTHICSRINSSVDAYVMFSVVVWLRSRQLCLHWWCRRLQHPALRQLCLKRPCRQNFRRAKWHLERLLQNLSSSLSCLQVNDIVLRCSLNTPITPLRKK